MGDLSRCPACREAVRWHPTERGKNMLVDPDPVGHSDGGLRVGYGNLAIINGTVHVLRAGEEWSGPVYVAHYARCRQARMLTGGRLRKAADRTIARVRGGER